MGIEPAMGRRGGRGRTGKLIAGLSEQWSAWDMVLGAWLDSEEGKDDDVPEWRDIPSDVLVNGSRNWDLYTLCAASQWSVLPETGGWLDQAEDFLHDVGVFTRRIAYLRKKREFAQNQREAAERAMGGFRLGKRGRGKRK